MQRVKLGWAMLLLAFTMNVNAQNWTPQQKEVWSNVETYWDHQTKGNIDGFMSYFSADYMGWDYDSPVPEGKSAVGKYVTNGLKNRKTVFYNITPVSIQIFDDIAVVNYYYTTQTENMEGKKDWAKGRWTDILQKQGPKWVLVADHGGDVKDK